LIILNKFTLCHLCREEAKAQVDRALQYIREHKGSTLTDVAKGAEVDKNLVLKLIQGGRLENSAKKNLEVKNKKNGL
jgi:hypothetical protein